MKELSWGKPKVEFGKLDANGSAPSTWNVFPEIVQGTAQLSVEEGAALEAIEEGGEVIATRTAANKYTFALTIFLGGGDAKPIEDVNGVVVGNYAVRLTPENPGTPGFIMENASVSSQDTWTSEEGMRITYTFKGLKPSEGNIVKPYPDTPQG